jgi:hypothetical protein
MVADCPSPAFPLRTRHYLQAGEIIFFLAALTCSFDIVLSFHIGFTWRICQVLELGLIALALAAWAQRSWLVVPHGALPLTLWAGINLAVSIISPEIVRSLAYAAWLGFSVAVVFALPQLFRRNTGLLVRLLMISYSCGAVLGLVQFGAALLGYDLLVYAWLVPGLVPRVSGFSFESSFYATYLIPGWVLCFYLLEQGSRVISRKSLIIQFLMITLALLLSTSRIGWAVIALCTFQIIVRAAVSAARRQGKISILPAAVMVSVLTALAIVLLTAGIETKSLMYGTGLYGTADHSVAIRSDRMFVTWDVFLQRPFTGYSLGGVPGAIGDALGITIESLDEARQLQGNGVFLEVLAATGIFGVLFFAWFVKSVTWDCIRLGAGRPPTEGLLLVRGLAYGVIYQLLALQFNQNILRAYLWLHIAATVAAYSWERDNLRRERHFASVESGRTAVASDTEAAYT